MNGQYRNRFEENDFQLSQELYEIRADIKTAASSSGGPERTLKQDVSFFQSTEKVIEASGSQIGSTEIPAKARSAVWKHFEINYEGATRFAICKTCSKKLKQSKTAGTGTLRNHILKHEKAMIPARCGKKQTTMESFEANSGRSSASYGRLNLLSSDQRQNLVQWIIRRNIPFTEVEDPSFREFIFSLNANVKIMSRTCAGAGILKLYDDLKPKSMRRLSKFPGG
jgi:BED zinc finger